MSEYGKGLIICLVKWAEHFASISNVLEHHKELHLEHPNLYGESQAVQMWANGASDHLYEIEVPKGLEWDEIRAKVEQLKDRGLEMGHGYTGKTYTLYELQELFKLTEEIAVLIDKKLGITSEIGEW